MALSPRTGNLFSQTGIFSLKRGPKSFYVALFPRIKRGSSVPADWIHAYSCAGMVVRTTVAVPVIFTVPVPAGTKMLSPALQQI